MEYQYTIDIAQLRIGFQLEQPIEISKKFQSFICERKPELEIVFQKSECLPILEGENVVTEQNTHFSEVEVNGQYVRLFHQYCETTSYAILYKKEEKKWICEYQKDASYAFRNIEECFGHIAFERILLEHQAMILHAALIKRTINGKEEGILFTGRSGIGKSTQADLWKCYEKAIILNGDRTIIRKMGDCWYGFGSPYAGSSNIYRNEGVPIRAIVVLSQSDSDDCTRLGISEAFRKVYAGLTINTWNPAFVDQIFAQNMELCASVPVLSLKCRPQQSAVDVLKKSLEQL